MNTSPTAILVAIDHAKQDGFVHLAQALVEMYKQQLRSGSLGEQSSTSAVNANYTETFELKEPMVYED